MHTHPTPDQCERRLAELLPKHAFYAPAAPVSGTMLERRVSRALRALYGDERADQAPEVEDALRCLYGAPQPAVPVHLASAAKAWAEVLAELQPDCSFVGAVDGIPLDVLLEHRRRRLEGVAGIVERAA